MKKIVLMSSLLLAPSLFASNTLGDSVNGISDELIQGKSTIGVHNLYMFTPNSSYNSRYQPYPEFSYSWVFMGEYEGRSKCNKVASKLSGVFNSSKEIKYFGSSIGLNESYKRFSVCIPK